MKTLRLLFVITLIGMTLASCTIKNEATDEGNKSDVSSPAEGSTQSPTNPETSQGSEPSEPSKPSGKMFGVQFLGSELEKATADEMLAKELTAEQIKKLNVVAHTGTETYLIVPKNEAIMTVYELSLDGEGLTRGAVLAQCKNGGPLYLTCNISDIVPNVVIVIQDGNTEYTYTPAISLKDGQVELGEWDYALGKRD